MRVYSGTRNWNSKAANLFLHHDVAIGALSHQEKSPSPIMWGTYFLFKNFKIVLHFYSNGQYMDLMP